MYPEVAQFSHPYTSSTRGRLSPPRGSGTASQSRSQSLRASTGRGAPTAPHAGCALGLAPTGLWPSVVPAPLRRRPTAPAPLAAAAPRGRGRAGRRRVCGGAVGSGAGRAGEESGPPNQGQCCQLAGGWWLRAVVRRLLLGARRDAPHRLNLRLRGIPASDFPPFALPLPSLPSAPSSLSAMARVPPPLLACRSLPCPRFLASVRLVPPASLLVSLTVSRAPLTAARARAYPMRLASTAAACARARSLLLPPSAPASDLALPLCLPPPPAAARAIARPWCLPPSSAACCLPTVAFRPLPCASALCTPPRTIAVPSVSPGPCLDHASLQLRQRDVHRSAFERWGADRPWPPLGEGGLGRVWLEGARRRGTWRPPCPPLRPRRPLATCLVRCPGPAQGRSRAQVACRGLRRGPFCGPTGRGNGLAARAPPPAGTGLGAGIFGSLGTARGSSAGGPTETVASASLRSSRSAEVSPALPGETGERERDQRWWRSYAGGSHRSPTLQLL